MRGGEVDKTRDQACVSPDAEAITFNDTAPTPLIAHGANQTRRHNQSGNARHHDKLRNTHAPPTAIASQRPNQAQTQ
jgi:hypothetical protein